MHGNPFLVVACSIRPVRRSPDIARWVAELGAEAGEAAFDVIDLRDLGLGLEDEPGMPAKLQGYARETTRRWSAMVRGAPGVVFVTPQYNWGYPAALKNAIDHLYPEWQDKPALIVTYGGHGGGRCAEQLRMVMTGVNARLTEATPGLRLARHRIEADDGAIEPEADFASHAAEVRTALAELVRLAATQPA